MSDLLSTKSQALVGVPKEFLPGKIPAEAAFVIGQLLLCSTDDKLQAIGQNVIKSQQVGLNSSGDAYEAMLEHLPINKEQPVKRMPANPADFKQVAPESVAEWFGYNGPLARLLPNYEPRREQVEMACRVINSFNGSEHLVVEAGTGIGKTMAYLVPSALWSLANSLPVVISTNTKNLQSQIFEKDLPIIRDALHKKLRYSVIKGRSNYICLARLVDILSNIDTEVAQEQIYGLAQTCAWLFQTKDGDISKAPQIAYCDNGANRLFSTPEECRGRKCPFYNRCFLQTARVKSQNSDIVITNHSVYFSEPAERPLALPLHAHAVFDEAHNLEEAATRKFLREVTPISI
ncbi:MAG: ATP-dependent DNA helicase, partial [Kiritimatiellae bacterium]|nr:ATP-dependent DNA helicase [Kiritimatiellia bacterium]